ncbi:MAG: 50S ribosomal protein L11 methyltransferase [Thermodesulfobacteriota bacterium]
MGNVRSVEVGEGLRLVPYWERAFAGDDRINIVIDPGPSFGAGDHPSTVMALELLELAIAAFAKQGDGPTVLDVGTGTGVLAIAARLLGGSFTAGFDTDAAAVCTARRNFRLNHIAHNDKQGGAELFVGNTEAVAVSFDIVLANLAAPTLIRLSPDLFRLTGRFLILSGIAEAMKEAVRETYASHGLELVRSMGRQEWNAGLWMRPG